MATPKRQSSTVSPATTMCAEVSSLTASTSIFLRSKMRPNSIRISRIRYSNRNSNENLTKGFRYLAEKDGSAESHCCHRDDQDHHRDGLDEVEHQAQHPEAESANHDHTLEFFQVIIDSVAVMKHVGVCCQSIACRKLVTNYSSIQSYPIMYQLWQKRIPAFRFATQAFDLAVIGAGPGGYVAAIKAAQMGLKTVCIEKRGSLGGTCLNVGCIPSKALLNISHKFHDAEHTSKSMGIEIQGLSLNWEQTQKKKTEIVNSLTKGIEGLFKKNTVTYLKGSGAFKSKDTIEVTGLDGKKEEVTAKNFIIATGSDPTQFPNLPYDQKIIVSSTGALSLPKVPKDLVVIGGGVIGLELGSVYQRLGTNVTVVEFLDGIVPSLDKEIAKSFHKILQKQGIKILTSHKVVSGKNHGTYGEVTIEPVKGGDQQVLKADHILVATGRKPHTDNLQLDKAGVKMDDKGRVIVNDHLETNVKGIYGIGDVVRGAMLAHKAQEQGIFAIEQILGKNPHLNYNAIPGVIYTFPEVATVGYSEEQLKEQKIPYKKGVFPFLANSRAKAICETDGMVKILSCSKTDKLYGAHIIGPGAGEMIAEAVIAIEYGGCAEDIGRVSHAHPTLSQAFKEACMATYDKPIHF